MQKIISALFFPLLTFVVSNVNGDELVVPQGSRRLGGPDGPDLIWAISYPQTGITGLLGALHKSTGTSMATNYGNVHYNTENALEANTLSSVPIDGKRPNGPFASAPHLPLPNKSVLVRTHCAGFCLECTSPRDYVIFLNRVDMFVKECAKSTKFTLPSSAESTYYSHGLVKNIFWLMRNPWDTVVARFKQLHGTMERKNEQVFLNKYSNDKVGFQKWCYEQDYSPRELTQESMWYENAEFALAIRGSCHAEFYRVVKFHNQVYNAAKHVNVDFTVFHYEDFKEDIVGAMEKVHSFLDIDFDEAKVEPFELDESYVDYFEPKYRNYGIGFMEKVLDPAVYNAMKRYLPPTKE